MFTLCKKDQNNMSSLVLHRVYYPVYTLGYGKRVGLWVKGCSRNCSGCISPELQDYSGRSVNVKEIAAAVPKGFRADGLTISGGEPFDQPEGIAEFTEWFTDNISEDVLIYTGYRLEELKARNDPVTEKILKHTAVLVDGPYISEKNDGKGLRGSFNQRVIVWKFPERYKEAEICARRVQFVAEDTSLWQIGIPPGRDDHE